MKWALFGLFLFSFAQAEVSIQNRQGSVLNASEYSFQDDLGVTVTPELYFKSGRPVLMAFVYFECPGACTVLLNGMIQGLAPHILIPGQDFEIVVISINPKDTPRLAAAKKKSYLKQYGREDTALGWHFLTGDEQTIGRLTHRLGFKFEYDSSSGQFNHPSALFLFTPDQVLSSVLMGVSFPSVLLRTNLVIAQEKKLGTYLDRINAVCYTFLPHFGPVDRPSRWAGLFGLIIFGLLLYRLVVLNSLRKKKFG